MAGKDVRELNVLVVEDNLHFQILMRTILKAIGVREIKVVGDGSSALDVLESFAADLAIIDWKLGGMDGIECIRRIRTTLPDPIRSLPVLLVTGYREDRLRAVARDAGANDVLIKPISVRSLMMRLSDIVGSPLPFIVSDAYVGPDRRTRDGSYEGADRRRMPVAQAGT